MQLFISGWRIATLCLVAMLAASVPTRGDETNRRTPLVNAIASCRDSVVNLRGRKAALPGPTETGQEEARMVNGMGTGIVIDSRGYVLTNYHVVQDIQDIQVTTRDHQQCRATLIAHDPVTDLAVIKINLSRPLPEIRFGRSADLMLAETVAAVGNAYGYEHTVTTGIVSHLDRTVQVNDQQIYENLIQTDAPINPGNSGGPLLNLDGEMIGVNVAVRIGAQGIAFAIPVDKAIEVAAELIHRHVRATVHHGLSVETRYRGTTPETVVLKVEPGSPAASSGIQPGDILLTVDQKTIARSVDFQRHLLESTPRRNLQLTIRKAGATAESSTTLALAPAVVETAARIGNSGMTPDQQAWQALGLRLVEVPESQMRGMSPDYSRGLKVTDVQLGSPASREGIQAGDILVAMHGWKTESFDNLAYILELPEIRNQEEFRFYVLRQNECFLGKLRIQAPASPMRQVSAGAGNR